MTDQIILGGNLPDAIKLGAVDADAMYLGANKVWPVGIDRGDYVGTGGKSATLDSVVPSYLSWTPSTSWSVRKWTVSVWLKRHKLGVSQMIFGAGTDDFSRTSVYFDTDDKLHLYTQTGGTSEQWISTAVFRDVGAPIHIVSCLDVDQADPNDRWQWWVNGVKLTQFDLSEAISQVGQKWRVNAVPHAIGVRANDISANNADVSVMQVLNIGDKAIQSGEITINDLGRFSADVSNWWVSKTYTGGYVNNNDFLLDFSADNGADSSGNGNDWTVQGAPTYSFDIPGDNFATLNPLAVGALNPILSEGNLRHSNSTVADVGTVLGTFILPPTGKFWWEVTCNNNATGSMAGCTKYQTANLATPGSDAGSELYGLRGTRLNSSIYENGVVTGNSTVAFDEGTPALFYVDMDARTMGAVVGTVDQGIIITDLPANIVPSVNDRANGYIADMTINFGQSSSFNTPPTGYKPLSSANLPAQYVEGGAIPDIAYTGNNNVDGVFIPTMLLKSFSVGANDYQRDPEIEPQDVDWNENGIKFRSSGGDNDGAKTMTNILNEKDMAYT